jgi:hypothetical protein
MHEDIAQDDEWVMDVDRVENAETGGDKKWRDEPTIRIPFRGIKRLESGTIPPCGASLFNKRIGDRHGNRSYGRYFSAGV